VPGDIIFFKAGERIGADARIIQAENLKVDESILTGEWIPSSKTSSLIEADTPLADRDNMVYAGCMVESGHGKAVCVATGKSAEIGKIADLIIKTKEGKTPLQRKMIGFSRLLGLIIILVCLFIFIGGVLRGENVLQFFEISVAIAVGGIPEGLPIVMTLILAIGMRNLLKQKGLVRKLASVETLGSARVICFDKTRTLTQGKMELAKIAAKDEKMALKIAALCNDAFIENPQDHFDKWKITGDPTDRALARAALKYQILKPELEKESQEISKISFDSVLKFQLSLRKEKNKTFLYITGAPERILERTKNREGDWIEKMNKMTAEGLRVLGVGYKELKENFGTESLNIKEDDLRKMANDFVFAGLLGFKDPVRKDAVEAIKTAQEAGLMPVIITGDHKNTALAVAKEIGLNVKEDEVLESKEIDDIPDKLLSEKISKIKIFARAEPRHKIRIIKIWQAKKEVVAMIGDGVNDAPALKMADVGVSLGSGAEIAKEVSDLILLDDSFSTLIKAVKEGRVILDNLRKAIAFGMSNSFASAIIVGFAGLFAWPLPILAVQILWNNIIEDSLPNLAYAFEPAEKDVMNRKPPSLKSPLFTREMKVLVFFTAMIYQSFGLILFWILWKVFNFDLAYCRTMIFGLLVVNTAFVVFGYKNFRKNLFQYNPFSNKFLNLAAVLIFLFFVASIYLPFFQKILHTVGLGLFSWLVLIVLSLFSLILIEITKRYFIIHRLIKE